MSDDKDKVTSSSATRVSVVPFTGGLLVLYAFFCPESYGTWLGTIVRAFRAAAGF